MKHSELNEKWRNLLQDLVDEDLTRESFERATTFPKESFSSEMVTKPRQYKAHDMLNTTIDMLNPVLSESYFTKSLQEELKKILNRRAFAQMSSEERINVQNQLDRLNVDEYEWKRRVTGYHSDYRVIIELFFDSYSKFNPMLKRFLLPDTKDLNSSQRAYVHFFPHKLRSFSEGMFHALSTHHGLHNLRNVRDTLTEEDFLLIIKSHLSKKAIFVDLVKVIMKSVRDNAFNHEITCSSGLLSETTLIADKTVIFYEYRRVFALNIITSILTYFNEEKTPGAIDVALVSSKVKNFIYRMTHIYDRDANLWWVNDLTSSVHTIMNFLEQSDFFVGLAKEKNKKTAGKTENIVYALPTKMEHLMITFTGFPRVVPPKNVLPEEIDDKLKQSLFGDNRVSKSVSFSRVLNIAQRKAFTVNNKVVALLDILMDPFKIEVAHEMSQIETIKNPFVTHYQIVGMKSQVDSAKKLAELGPFEKAVTDILHTKFVGKGITNISFTSLLSFVGVSPLEIKLIKEGEIAQYRLAAETNKRKLAQTHLVLGKMFSGFPIYTTNTYCVRLRLYPEQPFISRTAGVYKHILCEFAATKITLKGMVSLMKCFYIAAGQFEKEFEEFCANTTISKKTGMSILKKFFFENKIDFTVLEENFIYVSVLYSEILTAQKTGKTRVMVEIDQKASGMVFLGLGFRNKKLASYSNVISKTKECPYTYCMLNFPSFYYNYMDSRDEQAFNFLSKNKRLHKYASMCYTYSQKGIGRKEDFIERWYMEEGVLSDSAKAVLSEFAFKYDSFIESVYPGITEQIKNILELVKFVVNETGETCINNLNGEKLRWRRFKHKSITRKGFNPITKEQLSYRVETLETVGGKEKIDVNDHKKKFLAYLIHSIDAAVMHYFIIRMYEKHGYIINHLHDCVLVHPNYVEGFYDIVQELYSSNKLYNILETSVFEPAEHSVSEESAIVVQKARENFLKLSDNFEEELKNHLPENIYRPES